MLTELCYSEKPCLENPLKKKKKLNERARYGGKPSLIPAWECRGSQIFAAEANLVYILSSRTARAR